MLLDAVTARHNNPAGADCPEISVVRQRLLAAAQPERYTEFFHKEME
jgi:hypothetical protein